MRTAGFIGAGNMGGALALAASKSGTAVRLADRDSAKAQALAEQVGGVVVTNETVAATCHFIFLGVKPQVLCAVLTPLATPLRERRDRFVLVSMAAGVTTDSITAMLGSEYPIIRIMPNTPAAIGEGMILYTASSAVTAQDEADFLQLMAGAGRFDRLPESLIDAGSALSGCGPAFVYMFIEALADGAVSCGLPRDKALALAAQTVRGAASMVQTDGRHPGELKDAVCSPGGSTIMGVQALEEGALRGTVMGAVQAAFERTRELGK